MKTMNWLHVVVVLMVMAGLAFFACQEEKEQSLTLVNIKASYKQTTIIYVDSPLNGLKLDLIVTVYYGDSSTKNLSSTDYSLHGTLAVPSSEITVTYKGMNDTIIVQVTAGSHTHNFGSWVVANPPTATENGEETRKCSLCDEIQRRQIPPTGEPGHIHDFGSWSVTTPAACLTPGEETRVCSLNSSHKETRVTETLGHDWSSWTEKLTGTETRTCLRQGCTEIESRSTKGTEGLSFTLMGNAYSVSRGLATDADVVIPTIHEGLPVTTIASNGFSSYTNMKSIRIPDRVTTISSFAFSNCTNLISVEIPESVTSIGSSVFANCNNLTSITIPFVGTVLNGNSHFGSIFGAASASTQNSFIPSSLKTVIVTGGNIIPNNAFQSCSNLTSIKIPNSLTSIGSNAFQGCSGLASITIPGGVASISNSTFQGCTGLTSITIPDNVTSIGQSAFQGCTGLTSIEIPEKVTSIGNNAFQGCTGLMDIVIPEKVTSIGQSAFSGCNSLNSITIPFVGNTLNGTTNTHFGFIFGATSASAQNSSVPSSLKTVNVTSGNIIPNNAFQNCSNLTSVITPNGMTSIGSSAFSGCRNLTSITIGNSVTSIGNYAFSLTGLTSITIPNSVTWIRDSAFRACTSLTSITIGNSVTSTGAYTFYGCSSLTSITIPNSVTSIGDYAFSGCSSLTSITIGNSVTSIGDYAFSGCTGLTSVTFMGSINFWNSFPGDLRDKYLAGGIGTYTRSAESATWTKQ